MHIDFPSDLSLDSCFKRDFFHYYMKDNLTPFGNIISFISPVYLNVIGRTSEQPISSGEMLNFVYELPMANVWGASVFRTYFTTCIADILSRVIDRSLDIEAGRIFINENFTNAQGLSMTRGRISVSRIRMDQTMIIGYIGLNNRNVVESPYASYPLNLPVDTMKNIAKSVTQMFYTINTDFYKHIQHQ